MKHSKCLLFTQQPSRRGLFKTKQSDWRNHIVPKSEERRGWARNHRRGFCRWRWYPSQCCRDGFTTSSAVATGARGVFSVVVVHQDSWNKKFREGQQEQAWKSRWVNDKVIEISGFFNLYYLLLIELIYWLFELLAISYFEYVYHLPFVGNLKGGYVNE